MHQRAIDQTFVQKADCFHLERFFFAPAKRPHCSCMPKGKLDLSSTRCRDVSQERERSSCVITQVAIMRLRENPIRFATPDRIIATVCGRTAVLDVPNVPHIQKSCIGKPKLMVMHISWSTRTSNDQSTLKDLLMRFTVKRLFLGRLRSLRAQLSIRPLNLELVDGFTTLCTVQIKIRTCP